jgi:DNA-binding response OmpR family regulator
MKDEFTRILLIESNLGDVMQVREMAKALGERRYELEVADLLSTGLEHLKQKGADIILLNLDLPDSQGFDTLTNVCAQAAGLPWALVQLLKRLWRIVAFFMIRMLLTPV